MMMSPLQMKAVLDFVLSSNGKNASTIAFEDIVFYNNLLCGMTPIDIMMTTMYR